MNDDLIVIARIARPHGVRGEVIAEILTDFPERFATLEEALIKRVNGEVFSLGLEKARVHHGRVLLSFTGYNDVDSADTLRDACVCITQDQLIQLPEETWYDFELIDCEATTVSGERLGKVVRIDRFGAAPLLAVEAPIVDNLENNLGATPEVKKRREILIPLALSICVEIDVANKRIVVDPPEGLLDL